MSLYREFATANGISYLKDDHIDSESLIMDIDGTLIDTRESYNATIRTTVNLFYRWVTGYQVPDETINGAVGRLRLTGGFNNDWDSVYGILMGLFAGLPDDLLKDISSEKFELFKSRPNIKPKASVLNDSVTNLNYLLMYAGSAGAKSIEDGLSKLFFKKDRLNYLLLLKKKLNYPETPAKSLLVRVFEELYLGRDIFKQMYAAEPRFKLSRGFIENETVKLEADVQTYLKRKYGNRIGIASGRPGHAARKSLGKLIDTFFNNSACAFLDDAVKASSGGEWMGKPNEFMLLKVLKALNVKSCIYVGDSAEDIIMAKNASESGYDVKFIGVYGLSVDYKSFVEYFMKNEAAAIIPTINELKFIV
ncbi:MAG: HAD-IA family hydrolase [Nitrososphaerota archaeon]|jgi:HAD superfamily hydrolase (TIGR01549 family)|nr:HAD family hydrolase [Nitrososphaerota archaeon]MDG6927980.1 HAD-IA family hydrolase [Nitrososphaerota archaeon]MDG6929649.1 HAD-IA family hydrolase [Nitrososphaerota archaeon]MDG6932842.1 HAD-IA family hydrolase [Nitrososphaerota archaeon]MDG6936835.1 HAD-IA family hydrolase [Nitrososphaerota archaeon]